METVKLCWVQTCWMVLFLLTVFSTTSAHSEEIHDVGNKQERCHENSKWCSSSAKPVDSDDFYEALWKDNLDLAEQILKLPFLQHMQLGDLQADSYTTFMIQDIYYLAKVTDMLEMMSEKVKDSDLQKFMKGRYESYKRFRVQMLENFNLNGVTEIKVIKAMEDYLDEYQRVMEKEEPIMFAVSLLPCSRLWIWLANQLNIGYGNAYWTWKKNNMDGHPEKHFKDLLNKIVKAEDRQRAEEIFRKQMQNELNFFKASLQN
ncbi:hypothetical protein CRENBAI_010265 [Crenichthys baileyi]|uniref:Thiaminase-2/PQQC domain-containing protein n=1 Tax=Crenichthys baileyi TaxID=28760 RepID=A0AAV9QTU3_9TELE